jgi:hypothetical protein
MPFKLGLVALAAAGFRTRRLAITAVAALGLAWIVEEAVLTQLGFSGSDRYLTAPVALLIVAGAAGWGLVLSRPRVALAALAVALSLVAFGRGPHLGSQLTAVRDQGRIRAGIASAIARAGGAHRLLACGAVQTNPSEAPLAAWTLGVPLRRTESARGNVVIQSGGTAGPELAPRVGPGYRLTGAAGAVKVFERCA